MRVPCPSPPVLSLTRAPASGGPFPARLKVRCPGAGGWVIRTGAVTHSGEHDGAHLETICRRCTGAERRRRHPRSRRIRRPWLWSPCGSSARRRPGGRRSRRRKVDALPAFRIVAESDRLVPVRGGVGVPEPTRCRARREGRDHDEREGTGIGGAMTKADGAISSRGVAERLRRTR